MSERVYTIDEKYRFVCAGDGTVLDVPNGVTASGTRVTTYRGFTNTAGQVWAGAGGGCSSYLLKTTTISPPTHIVLEESVSNPGQVILSPMHRGTSQQWVRVKLENGTNQVLIKNIKTGNCLRSAGHGQPVQCVKEDERDTNQCWTMNKGT